MAEENEGEPSASEPEREAPSKLDRLVEEYRRRAARDHVVALLCVGMMLVSIGAAVVVFVFAGQIAINDVIAARTRQLEVTSEFIAEEGPRVTALVQQLAPAIEEVGAAATAVAQPMAAFSEAAEVLQVTYEQLRSMAEALGRLTDRLELATAEAAGLTEHLARLSEGVELRVEELEVEGLAFDRADLQAVSDELRALNELAYEADLGETLRNAGDFFREGARALEEFGWMIELQREVLRSTRVTVESVRDLADRTLAGIDQAELVVSEAGRVVGTDDSAAMLGDLESVSTITWTTRVSASVVLAGLLYALSVIYRNSRVSERRSNDIVTALVLSEGRGESLDRIVRLLAGSADEPTLVSPAQAAPLSRPAKKETDEG